MKRGSAAFVLAALCFGHAPADAGCAKFSCTRGKSGPCHFVVLRSGGPAARFTLQWQQHIWIGSLKPGDRYCASRSESAECPLRVVRDIKEECEAAPVS